MLLCKMHWCKPSRKKVMSLQSQEREKAISPFLSDRVTHNNYCKIYCYSYAAAVVKENANNKTFFCIVHRQYFLQVCMLLVLHAKIISILILFLLSLC